MAGRFERAVRPGGTLHVNDTVILVARNGMGDAEPELQLRLMGTYFKVLLEDRSLPAAICFYTEGVRLAVEGSPVLDILNELEGRGVRLILCRTCLEFFGLTGKVRVGIVGGMGDIVAAQAAAARVVSV
jgi:hypothetical protein